MIERREELIKSIEASLDPKSITKEHSLSIDGVVPALVVRAGSAEEVKECLRICAENNAAVAPAGKMTWLDWGNAPRRADVVLSLERMNRVIDYSPADLTATVQAGATIDEFNQVARGERQWLALDPPGSLAATLGAIAACNSSGALRLGYGTPRDYVLGLRLAHADATESKSGGRVVKNVAGYDLNKLYVGSFGTLAVLMEVTVKLRPVPECDATVSVKSKYRGHLLMLAKKLRASELMPVSILLTNHVTAEGEPQPSGDNALLVRFMENKAAVSHQVDRVIGMTDENHKAEILTDSEASIHWLRMSEWHKLRQTVLKVSVPLSEIPKRFEEVLQTPYGCVATADIGTGIIRMAFDGDDDFAVKMIIKLRAMVSGAAGSVIIERATVGVKNRVDVWGDARATDKLMQAMKARFDPKMILNPGRFVAGI